MNNTPDLTSMIDVVESGSLKRMIDILDSDPSLLNTNTVFGSWLHIAASKGQLTLVKELVRRKIDINTRSGIAKGTALHRAATDGHREIVAYLLECGASLDISSSQSNPLFGAILYDRADIADLLIAHGIDYNKKYNGTRMKNMDALAFARERGSTKCVKLLESLQK